jgi:hypothetical protein
VKKPPRTLPRRHARLRLAFVMLAAVALMLALSPTPKSSAAGPASLSFNGNNSVVRVSDNTALRIPVNLTLEAWIKPTAATGSQGVVGKNQYEISVLPLGSGFKASFQIAVGGQWRFADSGQLAFNQWYHVAGTYDGANMRLFVNGSLVATTPSTGNIDQTSKSLYIGSADGSGDIFTGKIDEVRVSNVIRYTTSFTAPGAPFGADTNTKGLWHLDEGSGTTTADSSGNNFSGTLVNGPTWTTDSPFTAPDTTPPVISNVTATNVLSTSATITWTTNEAATSQVEFGTTTGYGTTTPLDPSMVTSHSISISGLTATTQYHYRVTSKDAAGNQTISGDFTFTTPDPSANAAVIGEWAPVMNWPIVAVHMVLLYTGDILMFDAWETPAVPRLWNPTTQQFTVVSTGSNIFCSGHTMLADGRILIVGGHNGGEVGIKDTVIFNPATSSFTRVADMKYARWYPSATELADGRVVGFSGNISPGVWANTPEIYNASNNTWTTIAVNTSDVKEGEYPLSFLLPNGKVFVIAPSTGATRLLDVSGPTYSSAGLGTAPNLNGSAAMYRPGKVLYTGGGDINTAGTSLTTAAVVDMTAGSPAWRTVQSMVSGRYMHNLVVLADGKVLAVGGSATADQTTAVPGPRTAELWDPTTETWSTMAAQHDPRHYHSTTLLMPDGRVLSAGGGRWSTGIDYFTAEYFSPPYLFKGARPTITSAPASTTYGATMSVQSPDAASITTAAFVDLGANTHTSDMNQRYVPLSFTVSGTTLSITAPANGNIAPPGHYMLFLLNGNGVPSVAKIIQISGAGDTQAPTVSMTAPAGGSTVSGTSVTVSATASDNVGVSSVQFLLDGSNLGAPVTAPASGNTYSITWNTTAATNGSHTLSARASDAVGNTATAASITVTVSNVDSTPPVISAVNAGSITNTGATITWTTDEPATTQVEYGTTTSYGSTTALNSTLVTGHSQALTGLTAGTTYNYRVISKDSAGNQAVSGNFTFATTSAPVLLVGTQSVQSNQDSNPEGMAEAFQYTASASGTVNQLSLYIDASSAATQAIIGLYTNTGSNNPGNLLTQGTIASPVKGAWNSISVSAASVTSGTKYWIAVLGPVGAGTLWIRDAASGGPAQNSSQSNLTGLPATWASGASWGNSPMSAYAANVVITSSAPSNVANALWFGTRAGGTITEDTGASAEEGAYQAAAGGISGVTVAWVTDTTAPPPGRLSSPLFLCKIAGRETAREQPPSAGAVPASSTDARPAATGGTTSTGGSLNSVGWGATLVAAPWSVSPGTSLWRLPLITPLMRWLYLPVPALVRPASTWERNASLPSRRRA